MSGILKKIAAQLLLALIIIAQLSYTTYVFTFEKEGVHSDEIWSYGLANGYYQPHIYLQDGVFIDDATADDYIHFNEWSTGDGYRDYITVQPGEHFAYASVWHNQALDHHPPLYYLLLHTICSLFPNQFSFWYAYALSAVGLIGTQIFLYLLVKTVSRQRAVALLACAFYGFGTGALCTFIFLRQYHLLTMLGVGFTWCSARYCRSLDKRLLRPLLPTVLFAFLMFLTHYTAIAYVGVFTALFCLYMLWKRRFRAMFAYGGSILAALIAFFGIYPAALRQISGNGGDVTTLFSLPTQIRLLLDLLGQYNLGFEVYMFGTAFWQILPPFLGLGIVLLALLAFPFRHEVWFGRLIVWAKGLPRRGWGFLRRANPIPLITLLGALALYPVVGKIVDVYRMGEFAMRYIFLSFPLICFVAVYAVYLMIRFCLRKLPATRSHTPDHFAVILATALAACICVRVHIIGSCPFLFQHYGDYQDVTELLADKNVLIVCTDVSDVWMLTCYCQYVYNASNVFFTSADTIEDAAAEIETLGEKIDYCLVSAGTIELTEAETAMVNAWLGNDETADAESEDAKATVVVDTQTADGEDDDAPAECGSMIRGFSNGGDYKILFGLNIQGGLVYVVEIN